MSDNIIKITHPGLPRLSEALPKLEDNERIAIYLRFWENLSIQEIAQFMKLPWDPVDQLINTALEFLRCEIEKPLELKLTA
jgi:DNA-directed RNA polymerase specialized sigma24 family protein